jgi:hypothetical protein
LCNFRYFKSSTISDRQKSEREGGREREREIAREKVIEGETDRQTDRRQKKRIVRDRQGEHVKKRGLNCLFPLFGAAYAFLDVCTRMLTYAELEKGEVAKSCA